jgi:transcription elongation GreA/GreB family factor
MSRAFVKEGDDSDRVEQLPDRPQSPHTNYVTAAGLQHLQDRVAELTERRAELSGQESLQSRQDLGVVERDLRYFEERLQRAVLVGPRAATDGRVRFGDTVTVCDAGGREQRFTIVGEDEVDVQSGRISWVSPLATALLHAELGDSVIWRRPAGDEELDILAIDQEVDS